MSAFGARAQVSMGVQGGSDSIPPENFANLGSPKCHFLHFAQSIHKVSSCMTYCRQQLSQNHIIRFTCPLDRWDSIFCSALENQLLNNTVSLLEQLQNTGPYFKVLNRSGSVAHQSRQVFKERERYKTYKYKTDIEGIYFSMYYSRLQV